MCSNMKIKTLGFLMIVQFELVKISKGQCLGNGTCECHCVDCNKTCTECSPGWGGSVKNKCQRANTLYQPDGEENTQSKILDDNLQTSITDSSQLPFVRVELKDATQIDEVDVTLFLRRNTKYTFYVKEMEYVREPAVTCDTFLHTEADIERTITMKCSQPLTGKYLEIVSEGNPTLQVFEIQRLGMLIANLNYHFGCLLIKCCLVYCRRTIFHGVIILDFS
ncbi:uncharacterized protein LOC134244588 [Saccostrea cucullata]|uniref:uncharacterized protein LOC134244588 n=1 Tax=Saccostrea cuccullata TaxID=36930 RepID=UPI002ED10932